MTDKVISAMRSPSVLGVFLLLLTGTLGTIGFLLRTELFYLRNTMQRLDTTLVGVREEIARTKTSYSFCHDRLRLHEERLLRLEREKH